MGSECKLSPLKKNISIFKKKLTKYDPKTIPIKRLPKLFIIGIISGLYFSQLFIFSNSKLSSRFQYSYNYQNTLTHSQNNENRTIADQLFHQIRVLCCIVTVPKYHESRAQHVKNTWGQRCNKVLFMSTAEDTKLGTVVLPVREGYNMLWGKTKESFKYIYKHHLDEYDWFLKADDDTYVIMENLRKMLYSYSPEYPIYLGSRRTEPYVKQGIMHGGAGYVLSKEALKRLIEKGLFDDDICFQGINGREDAELGGCMANLKVLAGDSRDEYDRERMFPHSLQTQIQPDSLKYDKAHWERFYYKYHVGFNSLSNHSISFHRVKPQDMHTFEYLIYHLRPFGIKYVPDILPEKKLVDELITAHSRPNTS